MTEEFDEPSPREKLEVCSIERPTVHVFEVAEEYHYANSPMGDIRDRNQEMSVVVQLWSKLCKKLKGIWHMFENVQEYDEVIFLSLWSLRK